MCAVRVLWFYARLFVAAAAAAAAATTAAATIAGVIIWKPNRWK